MERRRKPTFLVNEELAYLFMEKLVDRFNRRIDYLRISVTDRCNLRCLYCMPECGITNKRHEELLTFEEIARVVRVAASLGIKRVRLTGGEPLVRKGIVELVGSLSRINGIEDISMTTNGILLNEYAVRLKEAGLKRVNISLDTLDAGRYRSITRFGELEDVEDALRKAVKIGLSPVKINALLLDGMTKDEVYRFFALTLEDPIHVRFLEFMPVNSFYKNAAPISAGMVMDAARGFRRFYSAEVLGVGPARAFRFEGGLGTFGIIAPMTCKFCSSCNRLRLTSDGYLKGCLHSNAKISLREPLRKGISDEGLRGLIMSSVEAKPKEHGLGLEPAESSEYLMCQIGG